MSLNVRDFYIQHFVDHQIPHTLKKSEEWFESDKEAKRLSYKRNPETGLLERQASGEDLCTISTDNCMAYLKRDEKTKKWTPSNSSKTALRNYGYLFISELAYYSIIKLSSGRGKHVELTNHPKGRMASFLKVWQGEPFLLLHWDSTKRQLDATRSRITFDIRHVCVNNTQGITYIEDLSDFYKEIKEEQS